MAWTITRTDDAIRLDLLTDLDEQGRPGEHRVFEYPLDPGDTGLFTAKGALRPDAQVATEIRRRVKTQLAAEDQSVEATDAEVVASGEQL